MTDDFASYASPYLAPAALDDAFDAALIDLIFGELAARNPHAADLAVLASLAARLEPELVRALRIELLPDADASAESDLWFSELVDLHATSGIVLRADAIGPLRARLIERGLLDAVYAVLMRLHSRAALPFVSFEERATYLGLRGDYHGADAAVHEVTASLIAARTAERSRYEDLSAGVAAVWSRLPEAVRGRPAAWEMAFVAEVMAGGLPDQADLQVVPYLVAELPRTTIRITSEDDGLQFAQVERRAGDDEGAVIIEIPATPTLVLALRWASGRRETLVIPAQGAVHVERSSEPSVELIALSGDVYALWLTKNNTGPASLVRPSETRRSLETSGLPLRSVASHVSRRTVLDPHSGIALVEVEIDDLELVDVAVLAQVDLQSSIAWDPSASVDGKRIPVARREIAHHVELYVAAGPTRRFRRLRWSYRIANALALTRNDPLLGVKQDPLSTDPGSDVWLHRVAFDYDRLTLELVLDAPDGDYFARTEGSRDLAVFPAVQRRLEPGAWKQLDSEVARASRLITSSRRCTMSWPSPQLGVDYGMWFSLAATRASLSPRFEVATTQLVAFCRGSRAPGEQLRAGLASYLETALRQALEIPTYMELLDEQTVAVCYLWNARTRLLRPCFGVFPPDRWSSRLQPGRGVAGHAFRFERPAAWHRQTPGEYDLIRTPPVPEEEGPDWVLALPILTTPDGIAIGVLELSGKIDLNQAPDYLPGEVTSDPSTGIDGTRQLATFAAMIAGRRTPTQFDSAWYVVNAAFWFGLSDVVARLRLGRGALREMVDQCAREFVVPQDHTEADEAE